ncbi:MAG: hypothetical protein N2B57_06365, partial [Planctomycetales bacterium]
MRGGTKKNTGDKRVERPKRKGAPPRGRSHEIAGGQFLSDAHPSKLAVRLEDRSPTAAQKQRYS